MNIKQLNLMHSLSLINKEIAMKIYISHNEVPYRSKIWYTSDGKKNIAWYAC